MNWDDLKVFLSVAQTQNVTRSGAALKVNAATVSRRIARLEDALGAQLFAKSPSGYHLTARGQQLLDVAKRVDHEMAGIEAGPGRSDLPLFGTLRVAAPDGCASFVLPQVFATLMEEHPALTLEIVSLARSSDLLRREVDVTIDVQPHSAKSIQSEVLCDYELVMAVDRDRLGGRAFSIGDHPFVGYIDDHLADMSLSARTWAARAPRFLASNSIVVQWNWITWGFGAGFVHDFALPSAPNLVTVQPQEAIRRSYYLSRLRPSRGVDHLAPILDLLRDRIAAEVLRLQSR